MGYAPRHPAGEHAIWHRKGRACQRCTFDLEVELGYRQYPPPPPLSMCAPIDSFPVTPPMVSSGDVTIEALDFDD